MTSLIIVLFYLSLGIIVGMIGGKFVSLRKLKLSLVDGIEKELHGTLSTRVIGIAQVVHRGYLVPLRKILQTLFYICAHWVLHQVLVLGNKLKVYHSKWYNMVKGKGVIKQKGSVSFFLRDIGDYKKNPRLEE